MKKMSHKFSNRTHAYLKSSAIDALSNFNIAPYSLVHPGMVECLGTCVRFLYRVHSLFRDTGICHLFWDAQMDACYTIPSVYIVECIIENFVHFWFEINVLQFEGFRFFSLNGAIAMLL